MNWGVLWYIDFADWSVISPCTKAIQTCVNFLVGTCSFTQYVLVQFYGKLELCENGRFRSVGHIYVATYALHIILYTHHLDVHTGWLQLQEFCRYAIGVEVDFQLLMHTPVLYYCVIMHYAVH